MSMSLRSFPALTLCANLVLYSSTFLLSTGSAPALEDTDGEPECRFDITASDGFKVRSVEVQARGGWLPQIDLPLGPGDNYSPDLLSDAKNAVAEAVRKAERQALGLVSQVAISFVDTCPMVDETTREVDVVIRTTSLRLSPGNPGSNILPVPRSNQPTFFSAVPAPLLVLNPEFGVDQDGEFGFSETVGVKTDLLSLRRLLKGQIPETEKSRLELEARGRKSLDEPFYDANLRLELSRSDLGARVEGLGLEGAFSAQHRPSGQASHLTNAAFAGAQASLQIPRGPFTRVALGGRYRFSSNRFFEENSSETARENSFEGRLLLDGRIRNGFSRIALWFDANFPDDKENHRRISAFLGYQKEFSAAPNQTIGLELMARAGRSWGEVPQYARFYGGNDSRNLLYEALRSPAWGYMPAGPLIRSFGISQAGAQGESAHFLGGTSYWGINLNLALPIPALSRALIPDVDLGGLSLRQVLKSQVRTAQSMLQTNLEAQQGLSPAQAQAKADRIVRGIRPAVSFIADQANLYALKPLFLLDIAGISDTESLDNKVRVAVGAGLQLTIVIAKFEVGYMRTLRRLEGDDRGNFVTRIVFQNLF